MTETMPSPIFYKNKDGVYLGCNTAFENYLGLTKDQIIGKNVYEIYPKDLADKYQEKDQALLDKTGAQTYETLLSYADGSHREVIINKATFSNADGTLGGLVGVFQDISDIRHAEKKLREQQTRLQEQLKYASALNKITKAISSNDDTQIILEEMIQIVGETLETDRTLIYDVDLEHGCINGLCEWDNHETPNLSSVVNSFELNVFAKCNDYALEHRGWIQSHANDINLRVIEDGSHGLLHDTLGVKSLLWYPFSFHEHGYYVLAFNHVNSQRNWREEEIDFIGVVAKQVEITIQKIHFFGGTQKDTGKFATAVGCNKGIYGWHSLT